MGHTPRAERFALRLPLRYRPLGETEWLEGQMENISGTGVLFLGERALDSNVPVELAFVLEQSMRDEPAPQVICSGRIVRTVPAAGAASRPALAAAIVRYRFVRHPERTA